jgi:hypothetical protein
VTELLAAEHLGALAGIALATAALTAGARRDPDPSRWLKALAVVLVLTR